MNIILKRYLVFFLSFTIIFSTTSAIAASPAGWVTSPADVVINGAQATITAIKGSGSNALKSVITHAPKPATVGKILLKGAGAASLVLAITQTLGDAVDYVLDPENNRVKYNTGGQPVDVNTAHIEKGYRRNNNYFNTPLEACQRYVGTATCSNVVVSPSGSITGCYKYDGESLVCGTNFGERIGAAPPAGSLTPVKENYIPIPDIASKVISNAVSGHAPSQDAIKAAAIDSVNTGALDTELQASAVPNVGATNPDGTVTNPDGSVTNPDGTITDPALPFDPSSIISAIKSIGSSLASGFSSITEAVGLTNNKLDDIADADAKTAEAAAEAAADAKAATEAKAKRDAEFDEWAKAEPAPLDPNTALDIDVPNILPVDTDINFGGSCPANFEVNSSIFGNPINIVLLDTSKFCGFLSTFVKFPVYAVSSLFALYILGGRKDV